jgi:membrane protease YdiL (CAAX protease family)
MVTLFDHILIAAIVALVPVLGVFHFRRMVRKIAAGGGKARVRAYRTTIVTQWGVVAAVGAFWMASGREWGSLGFRVSSTAGFWLGLGFAAAVIGLLLAQWRAVSRDNQNRERYQAAIEPLKALVPHNRSELTTFSGLSVTAGVCEEMVYRGYLIWYLGHAMGLGWAALGSSVLFVLGHAYQGVSGFLKTGAVGLVMAGLYLLTGSILVPIVLHAALDVIQGATAYDVIRGPGGTVPAPADAAPIVADPGRAQAGGEAV